MPDEPDMRPDVGSDAQDDRLDIGRRRSFPRWAIGALWAAVAAVAVTVVLTRGDSSGRHGAPGATTFTVPLIGASDADLAVEGKSLFELSEGALYRLDVADPAAPTPDGVATISGLNSTLDNASFHIVLDTAGHHVWVVTYRASQSTVIEFDSRTMVELGRLLWPSVVHAAVAFDGHLYLAATNAVVDIVSAKTAPTTIASLTGQYTDVVADPARSRLLLLGDDGGVRVSSYRPADGLASPGPTVPFGKGDLVVVGGSIWAGGFGAKGAVLARLDPRTLQPVAFSELSPQLGPGAVLVAAGERVLWVRAGGGGDGLWCVDGVNGDQLQYWQYTGAVTSRRGAAFVAEREGPLPLQLAACTG